MHDRLVIAEELYYDCMQQAGAQRVTINPTLQVATKANLSIHSSASYPASWLHQLARVPRWYPSVQWGLKAL